MIRGIKEFTTGGVPGEFTNKNRIRPHLNGLQKSIFPLVVNDTGLKNPVSRSGLNVPELIEQIATYQAEAGMVEPAPEYLRAFTLDILQEIAVSDRPDPAETPDWWLKLQLIERLNFTYQEAHKFLHGYKAIFWTFSQSPRERFLICDSPPAYQRISLHSTENRKSVAAPTLVAGLSTKSEFSFSKYIKSE